MNPHCHRPGMGMAGQKMRKACPIMFCSGAVPQYLPSEDVVDEQGKFKHGQCTTEDMEGGAIAIWLITPLPAGLFTENLEPKSPPIRFCRTPGGQIIIPGRWWANALENCSMDEELPLDVRQNAARASRVVDFEDILLPANTDTIDILAPDSDGNLVSHEAIKPDTCVKLSPQPQDEPSDV